MIGSVDAARVSLSCSLFLDPVRTDVKEGAVHARTHEAGRQIQGLFVS
jgi:hypothetical protein